MDARSITAALLLIPVLAVLTACGGGDTDGGPVPTVDADGWPAAEPGRGSTRIGPGTACPMPVSFDIPERWRPRAVRADASPLPGVSDVGGIPAVCEVDAKPAGILGFLRVFAGPHPQGAKGAVDAFGEAWSLTGEHVRTRETTANGMPAWEVLYEGRSSIDEPVRWRAFAVARDGAVVLVQWGGLNEAEHAAGLPTYLLAQATITFGGGGS